MRKPLAILLLVHKNFEQVKRLIMKLNHDEVDIYVHCDKRWDEGYNSLKKMKFDNVFISDVRYKSDLDTWSLVEAPMQLIKMAKDTGNTYKYYALLSGQDYLVNSIDSIIHDLNEHYPKPYIDCTPYCRNNWVYHKFKANIGYFRYHGWLDKHIKNNKINKLVKVPSYVAIIGIISKASNPRKRLKKLAVNLYGGSAWWILPDIVISYILEEYLKEEKYIRELSRTMTPEETFFQIMTMRSPLSNMVELNPPNMVEQNCKTYAYFWGIDKPPVGHPYIFTMDDINLLRDKAKNFFFARKFDSNVDAAIFDYIDNKIAK